MPQKSIQVSITAANSSTLSEGSHSLTVKAADVVDDTTAPAAPDRPVMNATTTSTSNPA